jgi:hypothetical protein
MNEHMLEQLEMPPVANMSALVKPVGQDGAL